MNNREHLPNTWFVSGLAGNKSRFAKYTKPITKRKKRKQTNPRTDLRKLTDKQARAMYPRFLAGEPSGKLATELNISESALVKRWRKLGYSTSKDTRLKWRDKTIREFNKQYGGYSKAIARLNDIGIDVSKFRYSQIVKGGDA